MTPDALAALHALCFDDAPRPWSANEIAGLLADATTIPVLRPDGFLLGRAAAGEAELLTVAVAPRARRRGLGATLVTAFEVAARARGATDAFLEVAETNDAARALYLRLGYLLVGRRRDYYRRSNAPAVAALVMRKSLLIPDAKEDAAGKTD
jgi:ribosomal-protein-alanine N-acetyltransferase